MMEIGRLVTVAQKSVFVKRAVATAFLRPEKNVMTAIP
jgi:hypothetical protein